MSDGKFEVATNRGLESLLFDVEAVLARRESGEYVITAFVGDGLPVQPGVHVSDLDVGAGDGCSRDVRDESGYVCGGLLGEDAEGNELSRKITLKLSISLILALGVIGNCGRNFHAIAVVAPRR